MGRNAYGAGEAWTPAAITTSAWYDASDADTITEATGVSQWDDKSGNTNHLTQGTGANQPATGTRNINGLNVLDFDGTNDTLYNSGSVFSGNGDLMVVGVFISESNAQEYAVHIGDLSSFGSIALDFNNGTYYTRFTGGYEQYGSHTTGSAVITAFSSPSGGDIDDTALYENGAESSSVGSSSGTSSKNIQAGFTLGSYNNGTSTFFDGVIGEIIAIADVTTATRQKIEGYLAHKWGLSSSLPGGHPYKTQAPWS
jgi:hypothetical protein